MGPGGRRFYGKASFVPFLRSLLILGFGVLSLCHGYGIHSAWQSENQ